MKLRSDIGCRTKQLGFTLLEVMVAMVLLATAGMTVYSWINSNLISLNRVREHVLNQQAGHNALAFMQTVNPMEKPAGQADVGSLVIHWQARSLEGPVPGVGHPFGTSLYDLELFDTDVVVTRKDKKIAAFTLRQVGYLQSRKFLFGL